MSPMSFARTIDPNGPKRGPLVEYVATKKKVDEVEM